jgi:4-aminobutyrate aminotransferase / (S)-3-amino-2-methylpropionate transaminase / 5-aminovalerate transaminase
VMELYPPGSMTSTHSGSPLPVAAALANIQELKSGGYLQNALDLDPILREGLRALQERHPAQAGCVHSKGLVAGIQIVKPSTMEPDPVAALAINLACFHRGLLMFAPVGVRGECIKIAPALDISREALEEGIRTLGEAMDEVLE